jgi:hypothetical protein
LKFGNAIAKLLFGLEHPKGRLPISLPNAENEIPTNTT